MLDWLWPKLLRFGPATEPPPTFPFLESQCQRAVSGTNFHHAREATPPARPLARRAAWARYIGGRLMPVKREISQNDGFFSAAVDGPEVVGGAPAHPNGQGSE